MEVFELRNLCVAWSGKPVVSDLCLSAPSPGALSLIGPPGAGKSSVLGAVAGAHGLGMSVSGEAVLDGIPCDALLRGSGWWRQPLGIDMDRAAALSRGRAAHEAWSAQRLWALHDCIATGHELYVLDEPTAGLAGEDAARARAWLAALARRAFVLMATRSRGDCLAVGGTAVLFDAGAVVEEAPAMDLFVRPRTPAGRHYAATGNLAGLHPRTRPVGVDGIWWVVPKLLCGLSRPGLVAPLEWQYRQLADAGVRHLVSLEERVPGVEVRHAGSTLGLVLHHFPMADGAAPALEQASGFCRLAAEAIRAGHGLAFHCRSGLGRTATALVAVLVWQGEPLEVAIAKVRAAQGCAIRSAAQRQFLREFATHLDVLKAASQTPGE